MTLTMQAGGRELLFAFDTQAWLDIEERLGSIDALLDAINDNKKPLTSSMELAAVTATCGERRRGSADVITVAWLTEHLTPRQIKRANSLARTALTVGMRRETVEQDEDEVIDVVLAELDAKNKKKDPD